MSTAALSASWLAARDGVDPIRIERRRQAGELFATRGSAREEWRYPLWQFDAEGRVRPAVARLLEFAKENRISQEQLEQLLDRKVGLIGGKTVRELLVDGGVEQVLAEVRGAAR